MFEVEYVSHFTLASHAGDVHLSPIWDSHKHRMSIMEGLEMVMSVGLVPGFLIDSNSSESGGC